MILKTALFHLSVLAMLLSGCAGESGNDIDAPESSDKVESTEQAEKAELELPDLAFDKTNRGTVTINGYERHFSVTFPSAYSPDEAYPVVLFFHGCRCRPEMTREDILDYLDWSPRLEPYKNDFIMIRMSAYSEMKPEVPQDEGGARGMWYWHEHLAGQRDDFEFVDTMIEQLKQSATINIDPNEIFGVGHSSGAIFLISYVLGGPADLTEVSINDTYTFKAISVTGGSTFRKGIVDFKEKHA
ncbi:MAG: hypothetical protein U5O39_05465 [Gammaproteobacteria bacterium]|nr:hypothetical protein [Gammaproteobacteria bacterium]